MTAKALKYAEDTLGVHSVYEEATRVQAELTAINDELGRLIAEKRQLTGQATQREGDIMVDERGKHPDHSQAAFDRHLKVTYHTDGELFDLRRRLLDNATRIDLLEFEGRSKESQLRLLVARLEQLGGYLHYLAAVKTEQQGIKTTETT
jgi:hypothetical protein